MRRRGWSREETVKGQRLEALPRTRRKERKKLEETAKPCLSSTDHWLATKFLCWFDHYCQPIDRFLHYCQSGIHATECRTRENSPRAGRYKPGDISNLHHHLF